MITKVNRPEWDALCLNPIETAKYILYFEKEIKLYCLNKVEWFAHILRFDPDPDIRKVCAAKFEFVALNLVKDESDEVRAACASHWKSCAKELYSDECVDVRWACMTWETCKYLMLMNVNEDDDEILQELALIFVDSENQEYQNNARDIIKNQIEYDENFAEQCKKSELVTVRRICAEHSYSAALKLVYDLDDEVKDASIATLLYYNDWYCLDSEELEDLCEVNEELALAILDDHYDNLDIRIVCVQLYESCAAKLILDEIEEIADFAQSSLQKSHNANLKLNLLNSELPNYRYKAAEIFLNDTDPKVRSACADVDEEFAELFLEDADVNVRYICTQYENCAKQLINDIDVAIRIGCTRHPSCAIYLQNDPNTEVCLAAMKTLYELNIE